MGETNGWRQGKDPVQRWLRVVTAVVCLVVFVYVVVSPSRGSDDLVILAFAIGTLLMLLGYEGVVRLPFIVGRNSKDGDDDV